MAYLILAVFPAALFAAAINDITSFKIPNWISVLLISAFPVAVVATGTDFSFLWQGALLAVGMLIVGFALFAFKIAGGGDGKLLAAVAPWVGFEFLMPPFPRPLPDPPGFASRQDVRLWDRPGASMVSLQKNQLN